MGFRAKREPGGQKEASGDGGWVWGVVEASGGQEKAGGDPPATRSELFTPFQPSIDLP